MQKDIFFEDMMEELLSSNNLNQKKPFAKEAFWSDHRLTLIAYESRYVKDKKHLEEGSGSGKGPKMSQNYESGFLGIIRQQTQMFEVGDKIKGFTHLEQLFGNQLGEQFAKVKEFVRIMLELKHSCIVSQFCAIYDIIVKKLRSVPFKNVKEEKERFKWVSQVRQKVLLLFEENQNSFPWMGLFMKTDKINTLKLLQVEIYCFLGEKFQFFVNQFYCLAFETEGGKEPKKRSKKQ